MREREDEFQALGVRIKIVTFDGDTLAKSYVRQMKLTWPLLEDPNRELYRAYGMTRGSWWQIYSPASILDYLRLIFSGRLPGRPGKDWRQLGGDVLIDPEGIVRLHHLSQTPHDRPSIAAILAAVKKAG